MRVPCEVPEGAGMNLGTLMNNGKNVHSIEGIPKDKPATLDGRYGLVDGPFQGIHPRISRDPGWFEEYFNSIGVEEKVMSVTYPFGRHPLRPVRRRSWHLA